MEMFDLNLSMQQLLICKMGIPSSLILKRLYEDELIFAKHSDVRVMNNTEELGGKEIVLSTEQAVSSSRK